MSKKTIHIQKIFVLDDNDDFRKSMVELLEAMDYSVEGFSEPTSAIARLEQLENASHACLLLDIRMPAMSGFEVHDVMNEKGIALPVIYMTAHADVKFAVSAMTKGALTFIEKPIDNALLKDALAMAFSDTLQMRRSIRGNNKEYIETRKSLSRLTRREAQILQGILADQSNRQIADELIISVKTVELYRSKLMGKLKARNAAHLIRKVMACEPA